MSERTRGEDNEANAMNYVTTDRGYGSERVSLLGFEAVDVGYGPTERTEMWCRVRFPDGAVLLVHPTNLVKP
jgi:hypothetical protein